MSVLRYFRAAVSEFYFDLPRMVLLNLCWFLLSLPFIFVIFVITYNASGRTLSEMAPGILQGIVFGAVALAPAGPATAGIYYVTNQLAHGELLELRFLWIGLRRFFWRGWGMGLIDAGAGTLLVLNIWFYWQQGTLGMRLLSVVFGYLLIFWVLVQPYLFSLLVEMDQGVFLAVRNALFLAIDNLTLTLILGTINGVLFALSIPLGALFLPLGVMVLLSILNNKAVVDAVDRYRASGRVFRGDPAPPYA